MKNIKKLIAMIRLYFIVRQFKKWLVTCNDPLKMAMIAGMHDLMVEPYNKIMPKFIKRIEVTKKSVTIGELNEMVKAYKPPVKMDA